MPRQVDQLPPDATSLARRVQSLERALIELRAAKRAAHTTISDGPIQVVNSSGKVIAEMTPAGGSENDPGFICYAPSGRPYYAMLSDGYLEFGDTSVAYAVPPFIEHTNNGGQDPTVVAASSGYIGSSGAYRSALWRLISPTGDSDQPRMEVYSDAPGSTCDMTVSGRLQAGSIAVGSVSLTPTTANTPISTTVNGLNVQGSTFIGFASAVTSRPGSTTTPDGVTGVSTTNVTSTGLTVWMSRQNLITTTVNWMVIGL